MHHSEFLVLVEAAKQRIQEINLLDLNKLQDLVLIDVREDHEWQNGHIPEAIHLSKGIIERDIERLILNKDQTIILYCGSGYRSALAADAIQNMGFSNVWSLQGGFKAWVEANLPVHI